MVTPTCYHPASLLPSSGDEMTLPVSADATSEASVVSKQSRHDVMLCVVLVWFTSKKAQTTNGSNADTTAAAADDTP